VGEPVEYCGIVTCAGTSDWSCNVQGSVGRLGSRDEHPQFERRLVGAVETLTCCRKRSPPKLLSRDDAIRRSFAVAHEAARWALPGEPRYIISIRTLTLYRKQELRAV
jgi:hypothetical protein